MMSDSENFSNSTGPITLGICVVIFALSRPVFEITRPKLGARQFHLSVTIKGARKQRSCESLALKWKRAAPSAFEQRVLGYLAIGCHGNDCTCLIRLDVGIKNLSKSGKFWEKVKFWNAMKSEFWQTFSLYRVTSAEKFRYGVDLKLSKEIDLEIHFPINISIFRVF